MINVSCPICGNQFNVKDEYAGKTGKCKYCKETIKVPDLEKPAPPPPSPVQKPVPPSPPPVKQPEPVVQQQIVYVQAPSFNQTRLFILLISAAGMVATFLPWITAPIIGSVNGLGMDGMGDGWISFVLFLFCALMAISGDRTLKMAESSKFLIVLLSVVAVAMFAWKFTSIRSSISDRARENIFAHTVQIGVGLYLVGVAGALNIVVLMLFNRESK